MPCIVYYFVLRPTNRQLFHKLSHCYTFRHNRVILKESVINTLPSYTTLQMQLLHILLNQMAAFVFIKINLEFFNCIYIAAHEILCSLARYWLQAPWGWRHSVEKCWSVIICKIIVHLLVIVKIKRNSFTVYTDADNIWKIVVPVYGLNSQTEILNLTSIVLMTSAEWRVLQRVP